MAWVTDLRHKGRITTNSSNSNSSNTNLNLNNVNNSNPNSKKKRITKLHSKQIVNWRISTRNQLILDLIVSSLLSRVIVKII